MAMTTQKEKKEKHAHDEESGWKKWKRGGIIGAAAVIRRTLLAITGGTAFYVLSLMSRIDHSYSFSTLFMGNNFLKKK